MGDSVAWFALSAFALQLDSQSSLATDSGAFSEQTLRELQVQMDMVKVEIVAFKEEIAALNAKVQARKEKGNTTEFPNPDAFGCVAGKYFAPFYAIPIDVHGDPCEFHLATRGGYGL